MSKPSPLAPRARDDTIRTNNIQKRSPLSRIKSPAESAAAVENQATLIDDDGATLWASPTDGPPLDLGYLAPGAQIVLAVRPQAMLQTAEGKKVLDALGPTAAQALASLEQNAGMSFDQMERLVVGWQVTSHGNWLKTLVVQAKGPLTLGKLSQIQGQTLTPHGDESYLELGDSAYYIPSSKGGSVLVVSPLEAITDIIDLAGEPPPLRRDVERLLAHTDANRDVTLIVTPNSLFSEGRSMFDGDMAGLRLPLFWFLGDELSAAALSLDWGENFFVELVATPTLDTPPEQAARILADRVNEIPDRLESYVVGLQPQPYGKSVIARFPAMIRKLSAYTRSGFDADHVVLNAYLPAVAGHNLLMGAELTLAESSAATAPIAAPSPLASSPPIAAQTPETLEQKLRQPTSLKFSRDTLDAALQQLSQDMGVPIVIRGPDLQADGITKNQSFGIDLADKPAEEVLIEILRLANPDKTATGPNDVKQKLVYVIEKTADGEQILVTTRAAAEARGDQLPDAFLEPAP